MTHKLKDRAGNKTGEKVVLSKEFDLTKPFELERASTPASNDVSSGFMNEKAPLLSTYQDRFYHQTTNVEPSAPVLMNKGKENWDTLPMATAVHLVGQYG